MSTTAPPPPPVEPPVEVLPGSPSSPVVVHVPHASRRVPPEARASIVLDDDALEAELDAMTDAATDALAEQAVALVARAGSPTPWRFVNRLSRLVVDPERFPDPAMEEMAAIGMGAVYTATSTLTTLREPDPGRDAAWTARWFTPYADALADLVDARLAATGTCVVVDLHSYPTTALPYERHADERRPAVCLGTDDAHTPAALLEAATESFATVGDVVRDEPFHGTYVPLRHWRRDPRVSSIMVELRRDTYAGRGGTERVVAALGDLLVRLGDAGD
ncbi:N-formylglutamate amidohydrolase [Nocardioides sp. CFH 31398]|uniref:N-formylglutamate amidohydrolase n=1 Tax=Nocardioides sp. CFH 31398 TaxID=2919579 RepID=UPI001F06B57E|nr:N-formylglutamate amidohydrolase [Nocardioides sp. CFH 31398]MCH1867592.1 N-formylglutamate amidohydrolase [Nocardioides sp. CFH 31398]